MRLHQGAIGDFIDLPHQVGIFLLQQLLLHHGVHRSLDRTGLRQDLKQAQHRYPQHGKGQHTGQHADARTGKALTDPCAKAGLFFLVPAAKQLAQRLADDQVQNPAKEVQHRKHQRKQRNRNDECGRHQDCLLHQRRLPDDPAHHIHAQQVLQQNLTQGLSLQANALGDQFRHRACHSKGRNRCQHQGDQANRGLLHTPDQAHKGAPQHGHEK